MQAAPGTWKKSVIEGFVYTETTAASSNTLSAAAGTTGYFHCSTWFLPPTEHMLVRRLIQEAGGKGFSSHERGFSSCRSQGVPLLFTGHGFNKNQRRWTGFSCTHETIETSPKSFSFPVCCHCLALSRTWSLTLSVQTERERAGQWPCAQINTSFCWERQAQGQSSIRRS